jgi:hypothetical protein
MAENKAAAGPILGFVGGLVILSYGAYELYLGLTLQSLVNQTGLPPGSTLNGLIDGGTAGILLGSVVIIASIALALVVDYPTARGLGVAMVALSVLSLVSWQGGNGVGLVLGVLGGTSAIIFGPIPRSGGSQTRDF